MLIESVDTSVKEKEKEKERKKKVIGQNEKFNGEFRENPPHDKNLRSRSLRDSSFFVS